MRLRRPLLDALLREHPRRFDIVPRLGRNTYQVTPGDWIGTIDCGGAKFEVAPKIRGCNWSHLLNIGDAVPQPGGAIWPSLVEALGQGLLARLRHLRHQGGDRVYHEAASVSAYLRGRLDIAAQMRSTQPLPEFHCHIDQLGYDPAFYAQVRETWERLGIIGGLSAGCSAAIEELLPAAPLQPVAVAAPLRREPALDELHDWLAYINECLFDGVHLRIDTPRLFEHYMGRELSRLAPDARWRLQPMHRIRSTADAATLTLQPDIVLERTDGSRVILDVKWKRLGETPLADDVQQVLAYALVFDATDMGLIYPGPRDEMRSYPMLGGRELRLYQVRVTGAASACQRGIRRLVRAIRCN